MLTMVLTIAMGGLALSAIYMAANSSMLSKLYDRERDYRYAAEWGLSLGKSRLITDTTFTLPDSLYVQVLNGQVVTDATGQQVPRVRVNVYAGVGGGSTGQYGRYVELVAVAYDNGGARHVRRLELQAENFARFAMFTDQWPAVCYATGEIVRGRAHSNAQWQSCGAPGPIYTDTVSAVGSISGTAQYQSARLPSSARINFPSVSRLSFMPVYAASANLSLAPAVRVGSTGGSRMEFVAVDLNGDGLVTGQAEGYFRVFDASSGATNNPWLNPAAASPFVVGGTDTLFLRASPSTNLTRFDNILSGGNSVSKSLVLNQCGVFYQMGNPLRPQFVPLAAHDTTDRRYKWLVDTLGNGRIPSRFNTRVAAANHVQRIKANTGNSQASLLKSGSVLTTGTSRCFLAGDPHLMPVERPGRLRAFPAAAGQSVDTLPDNSKHGGEDTTFTARTKTGTWRAWPAYTTSFFTGATRRQAVEERYLWPVHRMQNLNSKGIVYVAGDIYLSGLFRGRVTLYASGNVKFVDDLTYTTNPSSLPICQNLLGIITGQNIWIADNALNRPRFIDGTGTTNARFLDENQDFFLHGVTLVGVNNTSATFGVEALNRGPNAGRRCMPVAPYSATTSGGCINQAGGVIQRRITATFTNNWDGFAENRVKDACLDVDSPPYFPLTGRYLDNEFYEIDPAQFSQMGVAQFYRRLQAAN